MWNLPAVEAEASPAEAAVSPEAEAEVSPAEEAAATASDFGCILCLHSLTVFRCTCNI